MISVLLLAAAIPVMAQNIKVSGTVKDSDTGEVLPGVGISVSGTSRGTMTDIDGNFTIDIPEGRVLTFEYLGYRTVTEDPAGRTNLRIEMKSDINTLDEAVVMGYSSVKKTLMSSAVTSLKGEEIRSQTTNSLSNLLQGRVPGVDISVSEGPNSGATVRIRGTGSITASSSPLFVVDGIVGGTYNPNDVETVTVLKDAGATGIYGASGSGGVIVITTKHAAKGQESHVEFKATAGVRKMNNGRLHMMDSAELFNYYSSFLSKSMIKYYSLLDVENTDTDWTQEGSRLGVTQDYYVSASGSSGPVSYLASFDWFDDQGILNHSSFGRVTGHVEAGADIFRNFRMDIRMNFDRWNSEDRGVHATSELPWDSPYDSRTGRYICITGDKRDDGGTWLGHDKYNPFWRQENSSSGSYGNDFSTDLKFTYTITDWLTFVSTTRYSEASSYSESVITPEYMDKNLPNGQVYDYNGWGEAWQTSNLLRFSKVLGRSHNVSALAGYEYSSDTNRYISATGTGISNGITVLSSLNPYDIGGGITESATWSAFGQAIWSYADKYIVSGTLRADASSVFAPGRRVGWFPSASAAWVLSGEEFMKEQDVISFLKLRLSYGTTGNSNIGNYKYQDTYSFGGQASYVGLQGGIPTAISNPDLHWEIAVKKNVGLDISFGNFLTVNADFYDNKNKDLLLNVPLSLSSGFLSRLENVGVVDNKGVELMLTAVPVRTRLVKWRSSFNIAHNKNIIESLPGHEPIIFTQLAGPGQIYREGGELYTWYMQKWLGVDPETGSPLWDLEIPNEDGSVEHVATSGEGTPQEVGNALPKFSGGWSNTLEIGPFDLSANLVFRYGNLVYCGWRHTVDADGAYLDYNSMSIDNGLGWVRWNKEDESTWNTATHPAPRNGGNRNSNRVSSRYLEDGSFAKLKNVTVGYNFPAKLLRRVKLSSARVYLSMDNLLTIEHFSGINPEVSITGTTTSIAGSGGAGYPMSRYYAFGVNIKF